MAEVILSVPADLASVGARWEALQERADASFFQSWAWVGCLAIERFPAPWLLEAREQGETVALALFNRRPGNRLWLGESGDPAMDAPYVEFNGPLFLAGRSEKLWPVCLDACLRQGGWRRRVMMSGRVMLSGIDDALADGAGEAPAVLRARAPSRTAPRVEFSALPAGGYLDGLGANTRYQLRRSSRRYAAAGPLAIRRAKTLDEALGFLDALAVLHQATWTGRGRPGAFADPWFRRFHRELLGRAFPRGEIDLLRIAAGERVIGYLYNFRHRGRVSAYQSGFDYAVAHPHEKPGMTCHHLAIELAAREGATAYDFLAGEDRYKTSMANAATRLHWVEATRRTSLRARLEGLKALLRRVRLRPSEV